MAAKKSKQEPAVHVVFDTNCLYTGRIDKLFSEEASDFIRNEIITLDVDHYVYVPHVVRSERKRQMLSESAKLFPHVKKLEQLLGQMFVNAELIEARIESVIESDLSSHRTTILDVDYARIDWPDLVDAALFRHAPFCPNTSDKGFKDAIILESICQLHGRLPSDAQKALLCIVCNDERLQEALRKRLGGANNVQVCTHLGDLTTTLTAVRSAISQDQADQFVTQAEELFSDRGDDSLREVWKVREFARSSATGALNGWNLAVGLPRQSTTAFTRKHRTKINFRTLVPFSVSARRYLTEEVEMSSPRQGLLSAGVWADPQSRLMTGGEQARWNAISAYEDGLSGYNPAAASAAATSAAVSAASANLGLTGYDNIPRNALAATQLVTVEETFSGVWSIIVDWSATVNPSAGELTDPTCDAITKGKFEWAGSERVRV